MMIVLRLFSIIIITVVLAGCQLFEKREFVRDLLNAQEPCPIFGFPTNNPCHYLVTVTDVQGKTVTARIPKEAVQPSQVGCEKLKSLGYYEPNHPCPNPDNYPENSYQIRIHPDTPITQKGTYHLVAAGEDEDLDDAGRRRPGRGVYKVFKESKVVKE
jgi:hypothetical protein